MNDKLLTYTYPRTWGEAISRLPAEGQDAVAIERYKVPLVKRLLQPWPLCIALTVAVGVML